MNLIVNPNRASASFGNSQIPALRWLKLPYRVGIRRMSQDVSGFRTLRCCCCPVGFSMTLTETVEYVKDPLTWSACSGFFNLDFRQNTKRLLELKSVCSKPRKGYLGNINSFTCGARSSADGGQYLQSLIRKSIASIHLRKALIQSLVDIESIDGGR
jgi:hypothetical protein